jgi:chemotaxis protein methyltransferase CheR
LFSEELPKLNRKPIRILATDISKRVLETAAQGKYDYNQLEGLPPFLMQKYFGHAEQSGTLEIIDPNVKSMWLNLMNNWPMKGPFNLILCRNVMIYFDQETQRNLVRRLAALLHPGGHLFIGHAETISGNVPDLAYVQPAIYVKRGKV